MSNTLGRIVTLTLAGESHGPMIVAVLDGLPAGIPVDEAFIGESLSRRRPSGPGETSRVEPDSFRIVSGVYRGFTDGAPVTILVPNTEQVSSDYTGAAARPSHADWAAHVRCAGYEDRRGGGHFSGRVTVGLVAAGAIVLQLLQRKGIHISTDVLSPSEERVLQARAEGDSVGGRLRTVVEGLGAGYGEPWFDSLDSRIASAAMSIGGVKGISFGLGFGYEGASGSSVNDSFCVEGGVVSTRTNNCGGVTGGLSNGMPVVFETVVKPTPSISLPQESFDMDTLEPLTLSVRGRHDPCIVRRVAPVLDSVTALVIADAIAVRDGSDSLR